jgi:hypothetical protein
MLTTIRFYVALVAIVMRVAVYRIFGWHVVAERASGHVFDTWYQNACMPFLTIDRDIPMTGSIDQLRVTLWMLIAKYAERQKDLTHGR